MDEFIVTNELQLKNESSIMLLSTSEHTIPPKHTALLWSAWIKKKKHLLNLTGLESSGETLNILLSAS